MNLQFNDLGLSEQTLHALARLNYEAPTEVQQKAIPAALKGRDLAIVAKTGTGKTASFALPLIERIAARKGKQPSALIVSPTRELAQQTESVLRTLSKTSGHRIATLVGGVSYNKQMKDLRHGVDILLATPGRLQDMIDQGAVKLDRVRILVLDEADRMLDMGFLPAMKKIVESTPKTRQTMLFSATMDRKVTEVTESMVTDPLFIEVSVKGETADNVNHFIIKTDRREKPSLLQAVLDKRGYERVIVFTRTKRTSDTCAERLVKAGYNAEAIHSDRSQRQRQKALDGFRAGRTNILVATDVLARGIDVTDVEHVINYDLPECADDYIHRIGRTGRAGKEGSAVSFVSKDTRAALAEIEKLVGQQIPALAIEGFQKKEARTADTEVAEVIAEQNRGKRSNSDSRSDRRSDDRPRNRSRKGTNTSRRFEQTGSKQADSSKRSRSSKNSEAVKASKKVKYANVSQASQGEKEVRAEGGKKSTKGSYNFRGVNASKKNNDSQGSKRSHDSHKPKLSGRSKNSQDANSMKKSRPQSNNRKQKAFAVK